MKVKVFELVNIGELYLSGNIEVRHGREGLGEVKICV